MTVAPEVPSLVAVGFIAQLIDGCVGMGYGISASSILATLGVPPAITSATVHAAETVTAGVSSASHAWFRNIDRRIFFSLLLPGVLGGMLGATLLAHVPAYIGGGGWGTIVTSTMIARGVTPRYAIGTSNAVVFFVALTTSVTLWLQLGRMRYDMVLALLIGGAAAAPIAAWVTSRVPQRAATAAVGVIV